MGAVIDHAMPAGGEPRLELLFEREAGMVRPDGDDRHTRTIPIVARGVKRPYISRKCARDQETAAAPGNAKVSRTAPSAPAATRRSRFSTTSAARISSSVA